MAEEEYSSAVAPVLILTHRRTFIILSTRSSATVSADNRCLLWPALSGRLLLRVAVFFTEKISAKNRESNNATVQKEKSKFSRNDLILKR